MSLYGITSKRISTELKILANDPDVQRYFQYESSEINKELKRFCIYGYLMPRTEPYKHHLYKIRITLPLEFPHKSPHFQLLSSIYHPAFDTNTLAPHFCERCCFGRWRVEKHINQWIERLVNLIDQPDADDSYCVMNPEAKILYDENKTSFDRKALVMVRNDSCSRPNRLSILRTRLTKQVFVNIIVLNAAQLDYSPLPECSKPYLNSTMDGNYRTLLKS